MKVVLLVPEFPPDAIGGGGAVFESLARALVERGHELTVLTGRSYHGPQGNRDSHPFPVLRIEEVPHPVVAFRSYMPPIPWKLGGIRRVLQSADVIHAHGYGFPFIDICAVLSGSMKRLVFTLHGFPYTVPTKGGALAAAYAIYDRSVGRRILHESKGVTAVSKAVAREAQSRGRADAVVIPNGFAPFEEVAELNEPLRTEVARGEYLLCVGRLEWLKGLEVAINALYLVRERGMDLRLLIAGGDNGYGSELIKIVRNLGLGERVSFLGRVERRYLTALYKKARVTIVASRTEAFPAVPLETMSVGTPCIATRVGGVPDIAEITNALLLVEPGEAEELAAAVERVVNDRDLNERMRRYGLIGHQRFLWQDVAKRYEEVYASLR